jgi:hypothetical protein
MPTETRRRYLPRDRKHPEMQAGPRHQSHTPQAPRQPRLVTGTETDSMVAAAE